MIDLIFTVRQTLGKRWKFGKNSGFFFFHVLMFEKAYDSINKQEIWKVLHRADVPKN
jgi:hypothetical protein